MPHDPTNDTILKLNVDASYISFVQCYDVDDYTIIAILNGWSRVVRRTEGVAPSLNWVTQWPWIVNIQKINSALFDETLTNQ